VLQQRIDGVWKPVGGPALKAKVKLLTPGSFRISAGRLAGPVLKVPVAPIVTARVDAAATVSGTVAPLAPGTTVELQQDTERGWWTQVVSQTGPEGAFSFNPGVTPGTYRVRVAPTAGFAQGLSAQIELP
jgi:hypothetical protein